MRVFRFRLQTKLDLSRNQEKAAKEKLMTRLTRLEQLRNEQKRIRSRMEILENDIRGINREHKYDQKLLINKEYLHVLKGKDKVIIEHILEASKLADEARQELVEQRKETLGLEKLREKKWDEYLDEAQTEEQKDIDESAMVGFLRKQNPV